MHRFIVAFAVLALVGCSGTSAQLDLMRSHNELRIERVPGNGYDRTAIVRRQWDFTYDTADKATRDGIALRALAGECPRAAIVSEEFIRTDARPEAGEYFIRIKCGG